MAKLLKKHSSEKSNHTTKIKRRFEMKVYQRKLAELILENKGIRAV